MLYERSFSYLLVFVGLVLLVGIRQLANAAVISITWNDNSINEDGFRVERRIGAAGTYQRLADVGTNVVTYTDNSVSNSTTYCYRVAAFNSRGSSSYSNENCATTPTVTTTPTTPTTPTASFTVAVSRTGNGRGTVTSSPAGIKCSNDCSEAYAQGTVVILTAVAANGSIFAGWSGSADCTDGKVTVNNDLTCIAAFNPALVTSWPKRTAGVSSSSAQPDKIGVYRPSTGEWFLDLNGNAAWEGCEIDSCVQLFTGADALPLVGDWNGSGVTKLGLFAHDSSEWFLDANGNGIWDGCKVDICSQSFGVAKDLPLVGKWKKANEDRIAIFRPSENKWHLDFNGNETLQSCKIDKCPEFSIFEAGDVPVSGDWTGRGISQLGLFRPSTGEWFLDRRKNRGWNSCKKDVCISSFGKSGDLPLTGDWDGTGISKVGVFRPSTSEWFLDLNGNGKWDGPTVDGYIAGYGQVGDMPVVGKW